MFSISRLQQLMKFVPRGVFDQSVREHEGDKHRKGFSCWQQLVTMVYGQLSDASSLRVLEQGFNSHGAHHYHLGCTSVRRSTLADANARGNPQMFAMLATTLMGQVPARLRRQGQALVQILDATPITLVGRGHEWTDSSRTPRSQGLKLHVLYGLHEQAPLAHCVSAPNYNDIQYAQQLPIEPAVRYVFDKGYCDYNWWWRIEQQGAVFVTRFKRNAKLAVVKERPIAQRAQGTILSDALVRFTNKCPGAKRKNLYGSALRRIEVAREGKPALVLATNDLKSSALRIAQDYKNRWQVELFFKWIKQHLRIKKFLARNENAIRIQILTALIAYLLVALYAKANDAKTSLWLLLSELRASLFQRTQTELHRHRRWREQRRELQWRQKVLFT